MSDDKTMAERDALAAIADAAAKVIASRPQKPVRAIARCTCG